MTTTLHDQINDILGLPDWTQERLSHELTVSQSTVHRWTQGAEPRGNYRDDIRALWGRLFGTVLSPSPIWKEVLHKALAASSWNMKTASLAAGLNETYLRDVLERGRVPSIEGYLALARVLHVDVIFRTDADRAGFARPK